MQKSIIKSKICKNVPVTAKFIWLVEQILIIKLIPRISQISLAITCLFLIACQQTPSPDETSTKKVPTEKELTKKALPTEIPVPPKVGTKKQDTLVPKKPKGYAITEWTELISLDKTIILDLRYATANNFVKEQMYDCGRCFLRPKVARRVFRAHQLLQKQGLGLKMFDCYRPRPIQQKLWDKVPNASYVTPPWKGSMHNKGAAVDLTIVDAAGKELDMGTEFDYFGERGHHTFQGLPKEVLANRQLLKSTMKEVGLSAIRTEWWHLIIEV